MNFAYVHLLINHVPVILAPLGTAAAILALFTKKRVVWLYAVATLTLSGISAFPVMKTGDLAADVVKDRVPNVNRDVIEEHEESGDNAMWALLAAGAVAAYAWWRMAKDPRFTLPPTWLATAILITALVATAMVTYASVEGGYIIHKEAHGAVAPS